MKTRKNYLDEPVRKFAKLRTPGQVLRNQANRDRAAQNQPTGWSVPAELQEPAEPKSEPEEPEEESPVHSERTVSAEPDPGAKSDSYSSDLEVKFVPKAKAGQKAKAVPKPKRAQEKPRAQQPQPALESQLKRVGQKALRTRLPPRF